MHVSQFRIKNYKSFRDSGSIQLSPGFNVVVGANNAGKSALAEALSLHSSPKPHRSLITAPGPLSQLDPESQVEVSFTLSNSEFLEVLGGIPQPLSVSISPPDHTNVDVNGWAQRFLDAISEPVVIESITRSGSVVSAYLASEPVRPEPNTVVPSLQFVVDTAAERLQLASTTVSGVHASGTLAAQAAMLLVDRVYYFKAERLTLGDFAPAHERVLAPDASNLAACLHTLQSGNPARFSRLNALVNEIFPEVTQVTVPLSPDGRVHILIWSIDPILEREDLAVPLSESGTGIGQVLAILYVVLTAERQKTIIVDEPQSFLHPGAVRKLIEILKYYERTRHQYIVTTHSSAVITATEPVTLLAVTKDVAESHVESLDATETHDQDLLLKSVGARLSDVFGADNILWVEGPTEEACFPLVLSRVAEKRLQGTKILGVVQTGDFESKHSDTILEIYRRLSEGRGLLPPAIGFIFDREDRDEDARKDLQRRSDGKVVFTRRRMYENYLLHCDAIASVASDITGFREGGTLLPGEVRAWLEDHEWDAKYFDKTVEDKSKSQEAWFSDVHGAKLLNDMFQDLSETRIAYDKVVHGKALTEWFCDNFKEELLEVAELIVGRLSSDTTPQRG